MQSIMYLNWIEHNFSSVYIAQQVALMCLKMRDLLMHAACWNTKEF